MRFATLATLVSCIALSSAHIVSVSGPATYKPTKHSKFPLTFHTINGPITNDDLSVAVGLQFASHAHPAPALGRLIHNFNLQKLGHGNTGNGQFTLGVPLPKSAFIGGSGNYVIGTAVTNGLGADFNIRLEFFNLTTHVEGV